MRKWEVKVWTPNDTRPENIMAEAENEWLAILVAGRTGRVPLNVREIKVFPHPDAPRYGA